MQYLIRVAVTAALAISVAGLPVPRQDNARKATHVTHLQSLNPSTSPDPTMPPRPGMNEDSWWASGLEKEAGDRQFLQNQLKNLTLDQGKVPPSWWPSTYYKGIWYRPFGMRDTLDIKKGRKTLEKYRSRASSEFLEQMNRLQEYENIVKDREAKIDAIKKKFPNHPEVIQPLDHYLNGDLTAYKMKLVTHKKIARIYLDNYLDYIDNYETWAGLTDEDYARQALYESRINKKGEELDKKGGKIDKEMDVISKRAVAPEPSPAGTNPLAAGAASGSINVLEDTSASHAGQIDGTFWQRAISKAAVTQPQQEAASEEAAAGTAVTAVSSEAPKAKPQPQMPVFPDKDGSPQPMSLPPMNFGNPPTMPAMPAFPTMLAPPVSAFKNSLGGDSFVAVKGPEKTEDQKDTDLKVARVNGQPRINIIADKLAASTAQSDLFSTHKAARAEDNFESGESHAEMVV